MDSIEEKYQALAAARREDIETTRKDFAEGLVQNLPSQYPRQIHKLMDSVILDSYVLDGRGYAVNSRGISLASDIGLPFHHRMFEVLRDKLPPKLSAETFLAGLNSAQRFDSVAWLPKHIRESGKCLQSMLEIGAFLGHKAVRCAIDYLKPGGIYHAIELMGDNFDILSANILANDLGDIVKTHNIAISNFDGEVETFSKGRQRSGIVPISNVGEQSIGTRPAMKLSSFCKAQKIETVDFCYITVNGAELQVLEGAEEFLDLIKFIRIVSKYDVDGERVAPQCCALLEARGFAVDQHRDTIDARNREFEL